MWVQSKFCVARYVQVLWAQQTLRWSQSGCSERLGVRGDSWTLSPKCDAAVWEAAKGALTASQQSEIEEKRRGAVDQPTAHSARKQFEQEVESAHQRQHKAAVGSCVLLAETGDKVKEQASVEAALETSSEAGARFCRFWPQQSARGSSNATYRPASATRTWNPSWSISASCTLTSRGRRSPRHRVRKRRNRQHHSTQFRLPSQPPFPVSRAQQGAGWMRGRLVLVLVVLLIALVSIIRPLNQLGPLQWQKGVNGCRHGLNAYSSCLNSSHNSSLTRRAFLTSQMCSSLPHNTNQRHPAPHVSLFHRQLLPCLSCGLVQKLATYLLALQEMTTWKTFSAMRSLNVSSSPWARPRTASARTASKERRKGCCSWQPRPDGMQDRPDPERLRKLTCPRTLWLQMSRGCDCKDGGRASRHRSFGRRSMASGSPPKQTARSKGSAGVMAGAALRHRRRHRALQRACACFLPLRHCARRGR